jgi:hypothetical protein
LIGSARTGDWPAPSSAYQAAVCSAEVAYTIRPRPTQPCAAAHIGQCSPDVYTVAAARSSGLKCVAAHRASANSGCWVASPVLRSRLRSSARTTPEPETSTDPNGSSPAATADSASPSFRDKLILMG